jgi:hypothetical protein
MVMVYVAPVLATIERGFAVEPSVHLLKTRRVSPEPCGELTLIAHEVPFGHAKEDGVVYKPAGQFAPDTLNCVAAGASMRTSTVIEGKFAVMILGPSITMLSGFTDPDAEPLHPVN